MSKPTEQQARSHPSYEGGLRNAADRAMRDDDAYSVYFDGTAIFVRNHAAAPPPNATLICIAEKWNGHTVQLRFAGAHSEWVHA